jgi:2,3,4,5-tetrahydropyridine-2,6-dicarboxylate N-succinyltransferase
MPDKLQHKIEQFLALNNNEEAEARKLFKELISGLEIGTIRAAEPCATGWCVNKWVKAGILLGFKFGVLKQFAENFFDKDTLPLHQFTVADNVRIVTGGSSIRCGSYVAKGTIIMPPSYINIGAYIDTGSMVDSHALIGCCAQIGKNVHVSAASQIGGVLEPIGAMPVIIEDNVFIGGNCGVYEGVIVQSDAVLGSGVILNSSTPVFDNTTGKFIKKTANTPLIIPKNAVVIPGSRPLNTDHGVKENIQIYCPVIIKYRDSKTDSATALEDILR